VLIGWESVAIPADFARAHQAEFVFPYSHGLLASLLWSVAAGAAVLVLYRRLEMRWRAAAIVALAVFSHWVLDAVVHRPELPLAGPASATVGLGLWNDIPLALLLEAALVASGLYLFVSGSRLGRGRSIALTTLTLLVLAFTVVGMTLAPPPPSARVMAGSSLVTLMAVCTLALWIGRRTANP